MKLLKKKCGQESRYAHVMEMNTKLVQNYSNNVVCAYVRLYVCARVCKCVRVRAYVRVDACGAPATCALNTKSTVNVTFISSSDISCYVLVTEKMAFLLDKNTACL